VSVSSLIELKLLHQDLTTKDYSHGIPFSLSSLSLIDVRASCRRRRLRSEWSHRPSWENRNARLRWYPILSLSLSLSLSIYIFDLSFFGFDVLVGSLTLESLSIPRWWPWYRHYHHYGHLLPTSWVWKIFAWVSSIMAIVSPSYLVFLLLLDFFLKLNAMIHQFMCFCQTYMQLWGEYNLYLQ
jgi:hypothetical protein